jgi:ribosomal-protein-alanine N-acetyltransferase
MVSQMDELINLNTERLNLKEVTLEDCTDQYLSWLNDNEVNRYLESGFIQHDMKSLIDFVSGYLSNSKALFLAIRLLDNNKHIGNVKIDKINLNHKTGEYGILMGERSEWGKGYAKEASLAIIQLAFEKLGLQKINLGVIGSNTVALELYKKMGFTIEGVLRKNFYDKEQSVWVDEIRMGLLKEEFKYGRTK